MPSTFEHVSGGDPLLGLTRDGDKRLKVIETERDPIAPRPGLIPEWAGEGRCEKRPLLDDILPDGRFDVAASQRVRGFVAFATRLVQAGADIYSVQKLGRWKTISMVMPYAHHHPESLRAG
ncbi:MAG TPA: tyrosine-type recombinase/integrase [Nitrospiraceae bacterium]|nr:tyrosine-type recombinase/integrase [Nitrospiraceae bacterium]